MTIDTRTSIEPKDITAAEFECRSCGAKTIRKIDDKFRTPISCGNCGDIWMIGGNPDEKWFTEFIRSLEHFSLEQFRYILRFQVPTGDGSRKAEV